MNHSNISLIEIATMKSLIHSHNFRDSDLECNKITNSLVKKFFSNKEVMIKFDLAALIEIIFEIFYYT